MRVEDFEFPKLPPSLRAELLVVSRTRTLSRTRLDDFRTEKLTKELVSAVNRRGHPVCAFECDSSMIRIAFVSSRHDDNLARTSRIRDRYGVGGMVIALNPGSKGHPKARKISFEGPKEYSPGMKIWSAPSPFGNLANYAYGHDAEGLVHWHTPHSGVGVFHADSLEDAREMVSLTYEADVLTHPLLEFLDFEPEGPTCR